MDKPKPKININTNIKKMLKKTSRLKVFTRKADTYKFAQVVNYTQLNPLTYTILLKDTEVITKIKGKLETKQKLRRGDYVLCGKNNEKYGHKLEKILNLFEISPIKNKIVKRKGFKITKKTLKELGVKNKRITIKPSWGGTQHLKPNDFILLEHNGDGFYGIDESSLKKTYSL